MEKIDFSQNWNKKLDNDVFTTIRKAKSEKYYSRRLGSEFAINLNSNFKTNCLLYSCRYYSKLRDIPAPLLMLDTGANTIMEAITIFRRFGISMDDEVILLTFIKKKEV